MSRSRRAPGEALHLTLGRELALQDWIVLVYLATLLGLCVAGDGPRRATAIGYLLVDLAVVATALLLTRGNILRGGVGAVVYRVAIFTAVFGSFAHLQYILPTAREVRLDAQLYAFDKAVFGFEPAEVFDRFVTTASVEWFSFFYFGYFFILAVHVFPFLFAVKNTKLLSELSIGLVTLFCVGHLLYMVVPGYGPYQHLAGHFEHELVGPTWWRLMKAAVDAGEVTARTDIFPSLHTAAPTYLALFSFRHRRARVAIVGGTVRPFRYTWIPMAFFTSQIILSTMFLRWHYLVDVLAGLALATTLSFVAARVARWESARRDALGASAVWTAPWGRIAERCSGVPEYVGHFTCARPSASGCASDAGSGRAVGRSPSSSSARGGGLEVCRHELVANSTRSVVTNTTAVPHIPRTMRRVCSSTARRSRTTSRAVRAAWTTSGDSVFGISDRRASRCCEKRGGSSTIDS